MHVFLSYKGDFRNDERVRQVTKNLWIYFRKSLKTDSVLINQIRIFSECTEPCFDTAFQNICLGCRDIFAVEVVLVPLRNQLEGVASAQYACIPSSTSWTPPI